MAEIDYSSLFSTPVDTSSDQGSLSYSDIADAQKRAQARSEKPQSDDDVNTLQGWGADVAKSGASGLGRGIVSVPGIVGDVSLMGQNVPNYRNYLKNLALEKSGYLPEGTASSEWQKDQEALAQTQTPEERAGMRGNIAGVAFPTGKAMVSGASEYVPGLNYQPQTRAGHVASTVGEFVGSVPAFEGLGAVPKLLTGAKTLGEVSREALAAKNLIPAATAGATSELAGQAAEGTPYETAARIAGSVSGAILGHGAYQRFSPAENVERGERAAAGAFQNALDPTGKANSERISEALQPLSDTSTMALPSVEPHLTTAQLLRDNPDVRGMAQDLALTNPDQTLKTQQATESMLNEANKLPSQIEESLPNINMEDVLELPQGKNPRDVSSEAVANLANQMEEEAYQAKEDAWSHPVLEQAQYKTKAVQSALQDAYKEMGPGTAANIPRELQNYIDPIMNSSDRSIPFKSIQDIKAFANRLVRNPNVLDKSGAIALTTKLDDILTNTDNVMPSYMSGATYKEAPQAFDNARNATRQYYETFGNKVTKPLFATQESTFDPVSGEMVRGQKVIAPTEFLDKVFDSRGSYSPLQKYRKLQQSLPNLDLDPHASDWLTSKFVSQRPNGIMSQADLQKFMSGKYGNIVSQIPGLSDRLQNIVQKSGESLQEAQARQLKEQFSTIADSGNPRAITKWLDKNKDALFQSVTDPDKQQFINQLHNSSRLLQPLQTGALTNQKMYNLIKQGDMFTLMHGNVLGAFGKMGAGAAVGKTIGLAAPIGAAAEVAGIGGGAAGLLGKPTEALSRIIYGPTKAEAMKALNRAMVDPAFAKYLAQKPTLENVGNLQNMLKGTAQQFVSPRAVAAARGPYAQTPSNPEDEGLPPIGSRAAHASGGKVQDQKAFLLNRLMKMTDVAHKEANKVTEPMLNTPDDAVVKALSVAKTAI